MKDIMKPQTTARTLFTLVAIVLFVLVSILVLSGCSAVYDKDSPAVQKVDAIIEDAAEIGETIESVLADPTADGVTKQLEWASMLIVTTITLAESLRADLLAEDSTGIELNIEPKELDESNPNDWELDIKPPNDQA